VSPRTTPAPDRAGDVLRVLLLILLAWAPLPFGSVSDRFAFPLLAALVVLGGWSWARGHVRRTLGAEVPRVPGARPLFAFVCFVLLQLAPLPPALLRLVSPASYAFVADRAILPVSDWLPVSVSPGDTLRGLAFLAGVLSLYATVCREFTQVRWRRRLALTVTFTAVAITAVALTQAAAGTKALFGLFEPTHSWALFGPYVNQNHFAGYVVMAIPLAFAFAIEALFVLARAIRARPRGWLALGGPEGTALVQRLAAAFFIVAGLLASGSRGGFVAFAVSTTLLPLAFRRKTIAFGLVLGVAVSTAAWVGLDTIVDGFLRRGIQGSRLDLWRDMLPLVSRFPILGTGFNGFAVAYAPIQTLWKDVWVGQAHSDYLQVLIETGVVGATIAVAFFAQLLARALRCARRSPLDAGLLAALASLACHALVDFNWQIPANALTYVALAGLIAPPPPPKDVTKRTPSLQSLDDEGAIRDRTG
jgi:O-antigen ligase